MRPINTLHICFNILFFILRHIKKIQYITSHIPYYFRSPRVKINVCGLVTPFTQFLDTIHNKPLLAIRVVTLLTRGRLTHPSLDTLFTKSYTIHETTPMITRQITTKARNELHFFSQLFIPHRMGSAPIHNITRSQHGFQVWSTYIYFIVDVFNDARCERPSKVRSPSVKTTATMIYARNRLHCSLRGCSHCATATTTSSHSGLYISENVHPINSFVAVAIAPCERALTHAFISTRCKRILTSWSRVCTEGVVLSKRQQRVPDNWSKNFSHFGETLRFPKSLVSVRAPVLQSSSPVM